MESYRHTQRARGVMVAMAATAMVLLVAVTAARVLAPEEDAAVGRVLVVVILAILATAAWLFGKLTVVIDETKIDVLFGPGWPRKSIALTHVRAAYVVRNSWWYGWGIRLTPHGWLWNVAGLDAVELELSDGSRTRIGTDEPQQLESAVRRAVDL